jgi:hypothetical protein
MPATPALKKIIRINHYRIKGGKHMKKKKESGNNTEKWLLVNEHRKVIFSSENIADVIEEGRKYKLYEVSIEKKLTPGTCFF